MPTYDDKFPLQSFTNQEGTKEVSNPYHPPLLLSSWSSDFSYFWVVSFLMIVDDDIYIPGTCIFGWLYSWFFYNGHYLVFAYSHFYGAAAIASRRRISSCSSQLFVLVLYIPQQMLLYHTYYNSRLPAALNCTKAPAKGKAALEETRQVLPSWQDWQVCRMQTHEHNFKQQWCLLIKGNILHLSSELHLKYVKDALERLMWIYMEVTACHWNFRTKKISKTKNYFQKIVLHPAMTIQFSIMHRTDKNIQNIPPGCSVCKHTDVITRGSGQITALIYGHNTRITWWPASRNSIPSWCSLEAISRNAHSFKVKI